MADTYDEKHKCAIYGQKNGRFHLNINSGGTGFDLISPTQSLFLFAKFTSKAKQGNGLAVIELPAHMNQRY